MRIGKCCLDCSGTGKIPASDINPTETPCVPCNGTGYAEWGKADTVDLDDKLESIIAKMDDMADKVNDILDKCNDIFEKVN